MQYLFSWYYVPGSILSAGHSSALKSKRGKTPPLHGIYFLILEGEGGGSSLEE